MDRLSNIQLAQYEVTVSEMLAKDPGNDELLIRLKVARKAMRLRGLWVSDSLPV